MLDWGLLAATSSICFMEGVLVLAFRVRFYEPWLRTATPWRSAGRPMRIVRSAGAERPKLADVGEVTAAIEANSALLPFPPEELERRLFEAELGDRGREAWPVGTVIVPALPLLALLLAFPDMELWLAAALGIPWLTWSFRETWFLTRIAAQDCPLSIHGDCARAILACGKVRERQEDSLSLDARVEAVIRDLGSFAEYGHWQASEPRRKELAEHITQVQGALRDAAGAVFRDGDDALPPLVARLVTVMERAAAGRWTGLLDSAALPTEPLPVPTPTRGRRLAEAAGIMGLTMGAGGLVIGALALNAPAQYAAVLGMAGFLGGGLAWRGRHLGLTTRGIFGAVGSGLSAGPAPSPPVPSPPADAEGGRPLPP